MHDCAIHPLSKMCEWHQNPRLCPSKHFSSCTSDLTLPWQFQCQRCRIHIKSNHCLEFPSSTLLHPHKPARESKTAPHIATWQNIGYQFETRSVCMRSTSYPRSVWVCVERWVAIGAVWSSWRSPLIWWEVTKSHSPCCTDNVSIAFTITNVSSCVWACVCAL